MPKFSITHGQFEAMREALCKAFGRTPAIQTACAATGHKPCTKAANAALVAMRRAAPEPT